MNGDCILKTTKVYLLEKNFRDAMVLMGRDELFVRQVESSKFIVTLPHVVEDIEYVLATWTERKAPREYADIGRAVKTALKVGAKSIRFEVGPLPKSEQ